MVIHANTNQKVIQVCMVVLLVNYTENLWIGFRTFTSAGFKVHVLWECVFHKKYSLDDSFKEFIDQCDIQSPLKPGEALFGGRNEVFSMYRKISEPEEINYVDFCSLYPAVMCSEQYPLRYPTNITLNPPKSELDHCFGLVKAVILPPQKLPIPVLPVRHEEGGKIFYTLCWKCSSTLNVFPCFHTDEERQFTGTYTSFELLNAVDHGYKIIKILELWDWDSSNRSKTVFENYIKVFFKMKLASEGFPSSATTELQKAQYCAEINQRNQLDISPAEITNNPGLKNTAKRLINSLWGKLAVKPGKPQTKYITEPEEFFDLLRNEEFDINDVVHVSPDMLLVTYLVKGKKPSVFTNVVIASMVTSYARCWLYNKCIAKLQPWQIHYVDTDSIIYSAIPDLPILTVGKGLGELTDEIVSQFGVKDTIGIWCATGNKSYAFQLKNNTDKSVVKVKGFTLGLVANALCDIDMKQMVEMVQKHPDTILPITQSDLFVKDRKHGRISTKPRVKLFQYNYMNKILLPNYKTKPYGFVGIFPSFPETMTHD